ncbi:choline transporter protein 1 isoform X2 [Physcomitrium patens]|uniref:choline transporter protein 1 isoform X2 n=1 Tax=Physcomitrium patens TaxID=3218 RepID=UPI003CCC9543
MGRNKSAGPKGAIVGSGGTTPLFGASPVHNTSNYGSPQPAYVGPPAYAPYSPSAPPIYSAPGYADQEAGTGPQKPRIKQNRTCRDILFLILFLAYGVGIIIASSYGFHNGDPRRLVYGLDYKGNTCGDNKGSPNLKDYDIRYWLNPNQVYKSGLTSDPFNLGDARSICLADCPIPSATNLTWVCDYPEGPIKLTMSEWGARNYDYFSMLTPEQQASSFNLTGPCYPVLFTSTNLFWSCQLASTPSNTSLSLWQSAGGTEVQSGNVIVQVVQKALSSPAAIVKRYVADLGRAWPVLVVCGGIAPLVLSIAYLVLVRYFVGVLTWITIILLNVLTALVTLFFYIKAGWIGKDVVTGVIGDGANKVLSSSASEANHLKIVAVIMSIVFVVVVLVTLVLIKRLIIAVAVIKVATKAMGAIPSLLIYPIIPFIFQSAFLIYWVAGFLYLVSAGTVTRNNCNNSCAAYDLTAGLVTDTNCCGYDVHQSKNLVWAILYQIFGFFWTTQFITACCLTTIAGAVAAYYWARGDTANMGWLPVLSSAKRVFRYSLGSMALGSLLVAIIEMIRFLLEMLRKKLKALEAAPGGCFITICCCCVQCCLGCIEWTIKFINRNAYIVIAINGKGFCRAAGKATGLIVNNVLRVAAVNIIGDMILFLGKVVVSLASALFAFLMLDTKQYKTGHSKVSSPLFPVLASL